ncbi:MAG: RagB/SusD family nutrient uptake outer membrane protein [Prevotella sp.]|nr:RagB/SusD family nutrient uptake outer membrane protein [Prevotella sp.]
MKLKNIAIIGAAMLSMTACNEDSFLDNPPQGVVSENVLMTADGVDQLCTAAYAALMGPNPQDWSVWWYPTTHWTTGAVRADDALKGGGGTGDGFETHRLETFTLDATDGVTDSKWYHLYVSVQRCNSALKVLAECTDEQIPDKAVRIAEMRVLRAHYYFELQRLFNQIPWFDETVPEKEVAVIPNNQFTREQLLEKIAAELEAAITNLPQTQGEVGRVNSYMAKAYLAKVYLYRAYEQNAQTHAVTTINKEYLQKVVSLCQEIRSSGRYGLLDDFQQLDLVAYDNSKEMVWDIQYSMNDGSNSAGRINWSMLLNAPQGPYSGDGFFLPSQDLINAFQTDGGGLPEFGYQSLPDFDQVDFTDAYVTVSANDHAVDPRLDFVVGRPGVTWKTYTETPCRATWVRDRGTYGYHCAKRFFVSPETADMYPGWPWGASALNWHMIRYAHVLLWEAEALVELGRQDEARPLVNQIRQRAAQSAYVKAYTTPFDGGNCPNYDGYAANYKIAEYPAAGWTQDYARQAVRTESRLETALEGERFFDLVRWGIAADVMNKYIQCEQDVRPYYQGAKFTAGKDEYLPITNNQYKFSGQNYVQNPGYGDF